MTIYPTHLGRYSIVDVLISTWCKPKHVGLLIKLLFTSSLAGATIAGATLVVGEVVPETSTLLLEYPPSHSLISLESMKITLSF